MRTLRTPGNQSVGTSEDHWLYIPVDIRENRNVQKIRILANQFKSRIGDKDTFFSGKIARLKEALYGH